MTRPEHSIAMLFDLFVLNQRVRRLVTAALQDVSLRADEYAVYGLLFEQGPLTATEMARRMGMPFTTLLDYLKAMDARGHLRRQRHPRDGRAQQLSLTLAGVNEHRRTNRAWVAMINQLSKALPMPEAAIRKALQALDEAVRVCLAEAEQQPAANRA